MTSLQSPAHCISGRSKLSHPVASLGLVLPHPGRVVTAISQPCDDGAFFLEGAK